MTYFTGVVSPTRAALTSSILVVMAALVGGVSSLEGGLLGGIVIAFLMSIASQSDLALLDDRRNFIHPDRYVHAERIIRRRSAVRCVVPKTASRKKVNI